MTPPLDIHALVSAYMVEWSSCGCDDERNALLAMTTHIVNATLDRAAEIADRTDAIGGSVVPGAESAHIARHIRALKVTT